MPTLSPFINFLPKREDRSSLIVEMTVDRQMLATFPPLNGAHFAAEISCNCFPRIQHGRTRISRNLLWSRWRSRDEAGSLWAYVLGSHGAFERLSARARAWQSFHIHLSTHP